MGFDDFCGGPFWNTSLVWDSSNPDLPFCFQQSILQWTPCVFLWIFSPILIQHLNHHRKVPLPWTCLVIGKMVLTVVIGILEVISLCYSISRLIAGSDIAPVEILSSCIVIISIVVMLVLQCLCRSRGLATSGVIFLTWLLFAICGLFEFRSRIMSYTTRSGEYEGRNDKLQFGIFMAFYPVILLQLVLSCFADRQAAASERETNTIPCPETSASFLNQITFSFFTKMAHDGWRRSLQMDDLWSLNEDDTSRHLVDIWESHWRPRAVDYNKKKNAALEKATDVKSSSRYGSIDALSLGSHEKEKPKKSTPSDDTTPLIPEKVKKGDKDHLKLPSNPSLVWVLFLCLKELQLPAMIFKVISDALQFVNPQVLSALIAYVEATNEYAWHGYILSVGLLLVNLLYNITLHQYFHRVFRMGMNARSMLVSALFATSLKLSNAARGQSTVGEIVNLMAVDVQRFMDLSSYVNMVWSAPFQMILSVFFLWQQIGPSVFAGVAVMILLIPLNGLLAGKQRNSQVEQMKAKDERLKLVNEMLNSMKVLKLYAWEPPFEEQIKQIRQREILAVRKFSYYRAALTFIWMCAPFVISAASFASFVLSDPVNNILTPQIAFVSLSLFNLLRFPMNMLPTMITYVVQASVSSKRIVDFLVGDELDPNIVQQLRADAADAVHIEKGTFSWEKGGTPILVDIDLAVPKKSLIAVVGQVGAGKSSLISAMLGEMDKEQGSVGLRGTKAYVPQQAWIQNATLKNNILFAREYNAELYNSVVEACALKPDLEVLPGGDATEIGEKGINMSGGQKQRVSLARAVYQDCDIYLLDDPLSAVDAHVGKHIFEKVIGKDGLLKNKTRVLVTHSLTYLKEVDNIVVMKDGKISEQGTYNELVTAKGAFAEVLATYEQQNTDDDDDVSADLGSSGKTKRQPSVDYASQSSKEGAARRRLTRSILSESFKTASGRYSIPNILSRSGSLSSSYNRSLLRMLSGKEVNEDSEALLSDQYSSIDDIKPEDAIGAKLIQSEVAFTGKVKWSVYASYIYAVGIIPCVLILVAYCASAGFTTGTNVWLSEWSNDATLIHDALNSSNDLLSQITSSPAQEPMSVGGRLGGYVGLGVAQGISVLIAALLLAFFTMNASRSLHWKLVHNLLRSPMSFFDITPIGRIVNRCGKDIDIIDNTLPTTIPSWLNCILSVLANIIVVIAATPIFAAVIVPLAIAYYVIQRAYVSSSRQLKRLESLSRSPIYSHFQETITGASTLRSYEVQPKFILESEMKVDENNMAYYPNIVSNRWLAVYLLSMGNLISFFAALFAVIEKSTLSAGIAGLSISNAMNITQSLNWAVRMTSDLETNIVSVERVKEYSETPTEAEWQSEEPPDDKWPDEGKVDFDHFSTRYRPGLELVLRDVSFKIGGGEKVGIVGRTGAGKSSLTVSLFRIIEAAEGRIVIDGIDIASLGLHDVRSRLTIIPQDPVLFTGSLRLNLDPFAKSNDEQIWRALELSHLKDFVANLPDKLEHYVSEGGENLSVGQRQLVCLARALLRRTKILILDEATAAVDLETDDLIQRTIRQTFRDCTVLTIAHRLHTIMDNDRVMVLSNGQIAEFKAPSELLANSNSIFYSMAKSAGLVS